MFSPNTFRLAVWQTQFNMRRKEIYLGMVGILALVISQSFWKPWLPGSGPLRGHAAFISAVWWSLLMMVTTAGNKAATRVLPEREHIWPLLTIANVGFAGMWLDAVLPAVHFGILLLLAQLPYWMFLQTLGGINMSLLPAAAVYVAMFTVCVGSVAFSVSLWFRNQKYFMYVFTLTLAATLGLPWVLLKLAVRWPAYVPPGLDSTWAMDLLSTASAVSVPGTIEQLDLGGGNPWRIIAGSCLWQLALIGLSIAAARWKFARLAGDAEAEAATNRSPQAARASKRDEQRQRAQAARPRVWDGDRALQWKAYAYSTGGGKWMKIRSPAYGVLAALVIVLTPFLLIADRNEWTTVWLTIVGISTAVVIVAVAFIDVSSSFSLVLHREVADQTLSALLVLPLTTRQIVSRLLRGLLLGLLPSAIPCLVATGAVFLLIRNASPPRQEISLLWPVFGLFLLAVQATLFLVLTMNVSIEAKRGNEAWLLAGVAQYFTMALVGGGTFGALAASGFRIDTPLWPVVILTGISLLTLLLARALYARLIRRLEEKAGKM